jgi:hypothetical protein
VSMSIGPILFLAKRPAKQRCAVQRVALGLSSVFEERLKYGKYEQHFYIYNSGWRSGLVLSRYYFPSLD